MEAVMARDEYRAREATAQGWLKSIVIGTEVRAYADGDLEIRVVDRDETPARLP